MRKIVSKRSEAKSKRRNQYIVGGVLIFVMLFSTLGFAFQGNSRNSSKNSEKKITYGKFEFVFKEGFWFTGNEFLNFVFSFNPREVIGIPSAVNSINNYQNKPLYIYSQDKDAELEIYRNLNPKSNHLVLRIQPACPEGEKCEKNLPVKTCENNFLIVKESEFNQIIQKDNCVFINGPKEDLVKITDEFLFKLFGMIP